MSEQPWQPLKWCYVCGERRAVDILCLACAAELDMRIAAIVGEQPAIFDDLWGLVTDQEPGRCACGARIVNEGDYRCTRCELLDPERTERN